ncbi:MAG: UDP-N-acetylmuramoyl-L-alanine--D-glutamate ligase [Anaerolineae bacterium]|jgi:UDP-N-acetylmuramoylalanine--D-glutamate ligase
MGKQTEFRKVHTLVVGLAREGTALARFLAERGATVTVTDIKPAEMLTDNVSALADLQATFALGGHPLHLLDTADILFVSPGVPLEIPFLVEAQRRGLPLSSETRLFTRLCPAPIVGITGSSGKTTTTALVGDMLEAAGYKTWIGGNIGRPLIEYLDEMTASDLVVMELSSFQLEFFAPWANDGKTDKLENQNVVLFDPAGWSPPVAAVLNITPNHLDRHPSMEAYIAAKAHILKHQLRSNVAILNLDNPITRQMGKEQQQVHWFSLEKEVAEGAFLRGDELVLKMPDHDKVICRMRDLKLLGEHNVANTLAACAIASAAGAPYEALRQVATRFTGVEHRLELVREREGVRWYNDSIATTPERTVAALRSFEGPLVLLAGGRDKHLPWGEMAALTWRKVRHLFLFGEAAVLIEREMQQARDSIQDPICHLHHAGTLERAVALAAQVARPGDVVLLSPGGTSFDVYRDFAERGEHFRQLVTALE